MFDVSALEENKNTADIFTASNGIKVNLQKLRELNLDRINMPSRFQDSVALGQDAVEQIATALGINTSEVDAIKEAYDKFGYYDAIDREGNVEVKAGKKAQELLRIARHQKLDTFIGARSVVT